MRTGSPPRPFGAGRQMTGDGQGETADGGRDMAMPPPGAEIGGYMAAAGGRPPNGRTATRSHHGAAPRMVEEGHGHDPTDGRWPPSPSPGSVTATHGLGGKPGRITQEQCHKRTCQEEGKQNGVGRRGAGRAAGGAPHAHGDAPRQGRWTGCEVPGLRPWLGADAGA